MNELPENDYKLEFQGAHGYRIIDLQTGDELSSDDWQEYGGAFNRAADAVDFIENVLKGRWV